MKKGVFSIIVPCYNVEQYVVACVEKLQMQTYHSIEIILVDDGSIDHTYALCEKMAQKYQNVVAITHESTQLCSRRNLGQEATRNLGLEVARGEWICFVDSDDMLEVNTLEKVKGAFDKYPEIDFILMGLSLTFSTKYRDIEILCDLQDGIYSAKEVAKAFYTKIPWTVISCIGTKIYRRTFIDDHKLRFEKKYKYNEDGAFAIKAFRAAKKILYIGKANYKYLQRENSIMHSYRPEAFPTLNNVTLLLRDYFQSFDILVYKNIYILKMRLGIVWTLLQEEAKYKKKRDYLLLFKQLYEKPDVVCMCKLLEKTYEITGRDKIKVFLIKYKWRYTIYMIFKIMNFLRGQKI